MLIVIDAVWELIYGLVGYFGPSSMAANDSGNLFEYLNLTYKIVTGAATEKEIKNFVNIHICYAHHMKNEGDRLSAEIKSVKCGSKKEVKKFINQAYQKIPYQTETVYDELKESFINLCILCLN